MCKSSLYLELRLRRHEAWYRSGGGDDSWPDDFGVDGSEASQDPAVPTEAADTQAGTWCKGPFGTMQM